MVILGLSPLPTRISSTLVPNNPETVLLTVIHSNVPVSYAEVYAVGKLGNYRSIGRSESLGKDDSASSIAYKDGTVRLFVSEALPGQSGSTSRVTYYDFPNAVAPFGEKNE